jgi:hypothetical protein
MDIGPRTFVAMADCVAGSRTDRELPVKFVDVAEGAGLKEAIVYGGPQTVPIYCRGQRVLYLRSVTTTTEAGWTFSPRGVAA